MYRDQVSDLKELLARKDQQLLRSKEQLVVESKLRLAAEACEERKINDVLLGMASEEASVVEMSSQVAD